MGDNSSSEIEKDSKISSPQPKKLKSAWNFMQRSSSSSSNSKIQTEKVQKRKNVKNQNHCCVKCIKIKKSEKKYTLSTGFDSAIIRHLRNNHADDLYTLEDAVSFILPLESPIVEEAKKNVSIPTVEIEEISNLSNDHSKNKEDEVNDGVKRDEDRIDIEDKEKRQQKKESRKRLRSPSSSSRPNHENEEDIVNKTKEDEVNDGPERDDDTTDGEDLENIIEENLIYEDIIDEVISLATNDEHDNLPRKHRQLDISTFTHVTTQSDDQQENNIIKKLNEILSNQKKIMQKINSSNISKSSVIRNDDENSGSFIKDIKDSGNLEEIINKGVMVCKPNDDDMFVQCSLCHKFINDHPEIKFSKTEGFAIGMIIKKERFESFTIGGSVKWHKYKSQLLKHYLQQNEGTIHIRAIRYQQETEQRKKRSDSVMNILVGLAILLFKKKCSTESFEDFLLYLGTIGVDVGDISHSRHTCSAIMKAALCVIHSKMSEQIKQILPSTGLPPFLYLTADKSTINRRTSQIVLVGCMINGRRTILPIGAPLVYTGSDESAFGASAELSDLIFDTLAKNLLMSDEDMQMIAGFTFDGQYINRPFIDAVHQRLLINREIVNDFTLPLVWDPSHFLNLAVTDVRDGKHESEEASTTFQRFIKRCNTFSEKLKWGKGYAILENVTASNELPKYSPQTFAPQRFTSSALSQWETIYKGYTGFCAALDEIYPNPDPDDELLYRVKGQDFVLDLVIMLDIFTPFKYTMEVSQDVSSAPWKTVINMDKLINHLKDMDPKTGRKMPLLKEHLSSITNDMLFKDVTLLEGWMVDEIIEEEMEKTVLIGSTTRGTTRSVKKKKQMLNWIERDYITVINEASVLINSLIKSLNARKDKCVNSIMYELSNCLDFTKLIMLLEGNSSRTGSPFNKLPFYKFGEGIVQKIVKALSEIPQIKKSNLDIDETLASQYLTSIKNVIVKIIWGDSFHDIGASLFRVVSGEDKNKTLKEVKGDEKLFKLEILTDDAEFSLHQKFQVELLNKDKYTCVLHEKLLLEQFYTNDHIYKEVGRESCILLDFVWNLAGSEAIAETFFGVMVRQRKDGGQYQETLEARSIIDFCLPHPAKCPKTVEKISKEYLKGAGSRGKTKRIPVFYDKRQAALGKYTISKVLDRKLMEENRMPFFQ